MLVGIVDIGMYLLKFLAVAGGISVGAFGSGLLVRLIVRLTVHKTVPPKATRVVQVLGAAGLGWAVWMWAFGAGGSLFGLGGGIGGIGSGTSEQVVSSQLVTPPATTPEKTPVEQPPPPPKTDAPTQVMRIDMLGGAGVQAQRFYVIETDPTPHTLLEVQALLLEKRKPAAETPIKGIEIVIHEDSVAQEHPAVRELEKWAKQHDLTVSLSFPRDDRRR
jgi:hypothetical protein